VLIVIKSNGKQNVWWTTKHYPPSSHKSEYKIYSLEDEKIKPRGE